MRRSPRKLVLVASVLALIGATIPVASAGPASCANRNNNTIAKLLECVDVAGVREHQAAFQAIADANGGTRVSGSPGYDLSADYVAGRMEAAGYDVTVQPFEFVAFSQLGPSTLEQTAPVPVVYVEGTDYNLMDQTDPGNVTAAVTAVDLQLGLGNTSSSGCEVDDFAGFPEGNIALMQRGTCSFEQKAENAAAEGAIGAVIFNQGNTPERTGLIGGTLSAAYTGGIPVLDTTYGRGTEWAATVGLKLHLGADVLRELVTTSNVIAEKAGKNTSNVVMVGAHLDSVETGPGINDNGSGSAAILEVAEQMAKVKPQNTVRFAWWGAEESVLVGSTFYVNNLSDEEFGKIALYLNFDMVGSRNHVFFVYDGDDSDGIGAGAGPAGSDVIEEKFEQFYNSRSLPFKGTDFDGRSDYQAFILNGIPAGGLFTGAEGIKTPDEAALWGGTAGQPYDPCYHQACDTFANNSSVALDANSDAIAFATLSFAMSTELINGTKSKGNFKPGKDPFAPAA